MSGVRVQHRILIALCALALIVVGSSPVATAADAPPGTGPGTGPQPKGLGLGSPEALAQKNCAPNGHTNFNAVGTGPFCVNPWADGKDNGGATAPGVTATSVKVVVYIPSEQSFASSQVVPKNQATNQTATLPDAIADWQKVYDYAQQTIKPYQFWGRTIDMELVTATGSDETAQRADALEVISKKPFMVFDLTRGSTGGAPVFSAAVAARKIIVASASTTAEIGAQQSPYRYNYGADPDAGAPLAASFVGRTLAGKKAIWAGDKSFTSKTRVFGVVAPDTGFDLDDFKARVKQNGGPTITAAVSFDATDPANVGAQIPILVGKLKSAGVTSVVLFGDQSVVGPLTKAATSQDYSPEWVFTGYGYQEYDVFANAYDQEQMKHAFGMSVLTPAIGTPPDYLNNPPFDWYWGAKQGNTFSLLPGLFGFVNAAVQYAGPTLTAANVKKGLFAAPAVGGAATGTVAFQSGYGNTVGMPYPEYSLLGSDRAFVWYQPDTPGVAQAAGFKVKGLFLYMDGGKRYSYKDMPEQQPKFFDEKGATGDVDASAQYPGGKSPDAIPCTQCPSNGSAP